MHQSEIGGINLSSFFTQYHALIPALLFARTVKNSKLEQFFRSDFSTESVSRQAKLNAYVLLRQHQFMQAAALFLAAQSLEDAVRVCLDRLHDLQLAVVISRYGGGAEEIR